MNNNFIHGQDKKSGDLFTNADYLFRLLLFLIQPGYVLDHLSHPIPKEIIDLNKLNFFLGWQREN